MNATTSRSAQFGEYVKPRPVASLLETGHVSLRKGMVYLTVLIATLTPCAPLLFGQHEASDKRPQGIGAVQGRVVDEKGEALANAKVFIYPGEGPASGLRPAVQSDSEGAFLFDRLKPGRYTVGAEKPEDGYPDLEDSLYNPNPLSWPFPIVSVVEGEMTKPVTIRLGPKAGRFIGRVVDDVTGEPVRDASVTFRHAENPEDYYMGTGLKGPGLLNVLVPTKKRFVMAINETGYLLCWVGEKGCQEQPYVFEFSSPITMEFFITLRRSKDTPHRDLALYKSVK